MLKILNGTEFVDYKQNLYNNKGIISYSNGELIDIPQGVKYIIPGYIERHIHGGYGVDFMDGDIEKNKKLLSRLPETGVTNVFPTSMSMDYNSVRTMISNIPTEGYFGAKCEKIHLEGPFINIKKCGAQNPDYIMKPDIEFMSEIKNNTAIVSYAPELDPDMSFINYLIDNNISPSVVHSDATAFEIEKAYDTGLRNFSHFYNGSSAFHHREPGVINAGLELNDVFLELICDGEHVSPYVINQTYKSKGVNSIVLITDSMRAKGMEDGEYELGGQKVILKANTVRLETGSLAGSVLSMEQAVKNFQYYTNCSVSSAVLAATRNVAKSINRSDIGSLEIGNSFNVVLLDAELNVVRTYVEGNIMYDKTSVEIKNVKMK